MNTEYLTVEDLKRILHIGNDKAYKLCETRGFPAFRLGEGSRWLIDPHGLEEWVKKVLKTSTKTVMLNYIRIPTNNDYNFAELNQILKLLEADYD